MILDIRKTDFIIKPDMVDFIAVIWGVAEVSWVEFSSESFTIHEGWHERENAITYPYLPQKQKEMFDRAINEVKYQHLFSGETYSYDGHLLNKGTGIKPIILKDPEESFVIGDKFFYEYTAYNSRGLVHLGQFQVVNSDEFKPGDYFLSHKFCKYTEVRVAYQVLRKDLAITINNTKVHDLLIEGGSTFKSCLKLISTYDRLVRTVDIPPHLNRE